MDKPEPTQKVISMLKKGYAAEEIINGSKFPTLGNYLLEFICRRNVDIPILAQNVQLNKATVYRILEGQLNPSRDVLIRLSRALCMNLDQTQYLLKYGNAAALTSARARDIKIIDGILKDLPLGSINEELQKSGFPDLSNKRKYEKKEDSHTD